jgi:hypothetical protein
MNRFDEDKAINKNEAAAQPGDGIDRRDFLGCMAWAGTDRLWAMAGGGPTSKFGAGDEGGRPKSPQVGRFPFVQISDCHIGFNKGANPNVTGTLTKAIDRDNVVSACMKAPDITQNSKSAEFDTAPR